MSKNGFLWRGLAALILVGLLIVGGLATHYVGWSQGYAAGQLAEDEEAATPPYVPHGWPIAPYPFGAGLLFKILLLLLFLAIIGKLIRFVVWGVAFRPMMAGPWPRHWHRAARWHWAHGPMPPWCWGWGEPGAEEAAETESRPGAEG
jgi:hypothetical protein